MVPFSVYLCLSAHDIVVEEIYLNLIGLWEPGGVGGSKMCLWTPLHNLVLPAIRQPVGGKPSSLHESKEGELGTSIIRYIYRQLLYRIIICHHRKSCVHHTHRWLLVWISSAYKHIQPRIITLLDVMLKVFDENLTMGWIHAKSLCGHPHES